MSSALLACFVEHARMLESARQLRVVFRDSYGEADDPNFDDDHEIEENGLLMGHLEVIIGEMMRLSERLPEFTIEQEVEYSMLSSALTDITSFRGTGWICLLDSAINVFVDILETGRIDQ